MPIDATTKGLVMMTTGTPGSRPTTLAWEHCTCGCGCFVTTVLGKTYSIYASNNTLMLGHRQFCMSVGTYRSFEEADAELRKRLAPEIESAKALLAEYGHLFNFE